MGTIAYMSPEQVRGEEMDARTDLFSFGVVLYEMVTGVLPFRGDTAVVVGEAILNRTQVAPVRLNPDVPPRLEEIINKALEKDRKLRYQSAADLQTDLRRLARDSSRSHWDALSVKAGAGKRKRATACKTKAWKALLLCCGCCSCFDDCGCISFPTLDTWRCTSQQRVGAADILYGLGGVSHSLFGRTNARFHSRRQLIHHRWRPLRKVVARRRARPTDPRFEGKTGPVVLSG